MKASSARRTKLVVPKGSNAPIKQRAVDLFSTENWKTLSEAEASSRPKPVTTVHAPAPTPFFDEPAEPASWTLHDAFSKDLLRGSTVWFLYCERFHGVLPIQVSVD